MASHTNRKSTPPDFTVSKLPHRPQQDLFFGSKVTLQNHKQRLSIQAERVAAQTRKKQSQVARILFDHGDRDEGDRVDRKEGSAGSVARNLQRDGRLERGSHGSYAGNRKNALGLPLPLFETPPNPVPAPRKQLPNSISTTTTPKRPINPSAPGWVNVGRYTSIFDAKFDPRATSSTPLDQIPISNTNTSQTSSARSNSVFYTRGPKAGLRKPVRSSSTTPASVSSVKSTTKVTTDRSSFARSQSYSSTRSDGTSDPAGRPNRAHTTRPERAMFGISESSENEFEPSIANHSSLHTGSTVTGSTTSQSTITNSSSTDCTIFTNSTATPDPEIRHVFAARRDLRQPILLPNGRPSRFDAWRQDIPPGAPPSEASEASYDSSYASTSSTVRTPINRAGFRRMAKERKYTTCSPSRIVSSSPDPLGSWTDLEMTLNLNSPARSTSTAGSGSTIRAGRRRDS